jgi:arylsulfatase A-like enzyme
MPEISRRQFALAPALLARKRRPNVIVLISDDQGYGDLSLHGNPHLKTPHLDSIATEGVQFTQFHSSPVCSPTRASLMTGRWNYRTGVVDTYIGRSLMRPDEVTMPQALGAAGYATGIFGKWHLGDNYPLRAMDRGFQEALTHKGGGLAQPSGPPGEGYFDPVLSFNGHDRQTRGFCTDIFFDGAIEFIQRHAKRPFFTYIAANAPHTPLQVDPKWVEPYTRMGLDDTTARIYGMVANLDHNTGRLLGSLRKLGLEKDTILVFLTDNGPQQRRFNAGMRGLKGSVYQGGIRVPCFLRWPGRVPAGTRVDRIGAHVDLLPTILEACEAPLPAGRQIDGRSLLPLATGTRTEWPDRKLFLQWHRGDAPEPHRNAAVRTQQWKLVDGKELYDLNQDPGESKDLASTLPQVAAELRKAYDEWFEDVGRPGYAPPRIHIGAKQENPVILTRQDWRGPRAGWDDNSLGFYEVEVRQRGPYEITLRFPPQPQPRTAELEFRGQVQKVEVPANAAEATLSGVTLPPGTGRLEGRIAAQPQPVGVHYIQVRSL